MRIILSGGGTAGHLYPALAVADKLVQVGNEVLFVGTENGLEHRLVEEAGFPFTAIPAAGFDRARPWTLVSSGAKVAVSGLKARTLLRSFKPDVCIGFGGYVSIPVGLAAAALHIPLMVHEQNSVAGMTNTFLAKRAAAVCVTYPDTVASLEAITPGQVIVTGNPVRTSVLEASREEARRRRCLTEEDVLLLVFGGSRGARHINNAFVALAANLLSDEHLHVVHATGTGEYDAVVAALGAQAHHPRYEVIPYIEDMGALLAAVDLSVCRAGATSIAELTALGVPAVLVPYPYATDDHQTKNAQTMVEHGAAVLVPDDELDTVDFDELLDDLLENRGKRILMAQASRELGRRNATELLVDSIYSVVGTSRNE